MDEFNVVPGLRTGYDEEILNGEYPYKDNKFTFLVNIGDSIYYIFEEFYISPDIPITPGPEQEEDNIALQISANVPGITVNLLINNYVSRRVILNGTSISYKNNFKEGDIVSYTATKTGYYSVSGEIVIPDSIYIELEEIENTGNQEVILGTIRFKSNYVGATINLTYTNIDNNDITLSGTSKFLNASVDFIVENCIYVSYTATSGNDSKSDSFDFSTGEKIIILTFSDGEDYGNTGDIIDGGEDNHGGGGNPGGGGSNDKITQKGEKNLYFGVYRVDTLYGKRLSLPVFLKYSSGRPTGNDAPYSIQGMLNIYSSNSSVIDISKDNYTGSDTLYNSCDNNTVPAIVHIPRKKIKSLGNSTISAVLLSDTSVADNCIVNVFANDLNGNSLSDYSTKNIIYPFEIYVGKNTYFDIWVHHHHFSDQVIVISDETAISLVDDNAIEESLGYTLQESSHAVRFQTFNKTGTYQISFTDSSSTYSGTYTAIIHILDDSEVPTNEDPGGNSGGNNGGGNNSNSPYLIFRGQSSKLTTKYYDAEASYSGTISVGIDSNTKWKVYEYPDWVSVSPTSTLTGNNNINITISSFNGTVGRRIGYIKIRGTIDTRLELTFILVQFTADKNSEYATITYSSGANPNGYIYYTGGQTVFNIASNTDWFAEGDNELGFSPKGGYNNSTLNVTVYENDGNFSTTYRNFYLTSIKNRVRISDEVRYENILSSSTISNWNNLDHFLIHPDEKTLLFNGEAGEFTIYIIPHVNWEITSYPSWIQNIDILSGGPGAYIIHAYFEGSTTEKSGQIVISSKDTNLPPFSSNISVSTTGQLRTTELKYLFFGIKSGYSVDISESQTKTFDVYSNVNWWVVSTSKGNGYGYIDWGSTIYSNKGSNNGSLTAKFTWGAVRYEFYGTEYIDNGDYTFTQVGDNLIEFCFEGRDLDVDSIKGEGGIYISPTSMGSAPSSSNSSIKINDKNYITFYKLGGSFSIPLQSSSSWYADYPSWCRLDITSGNGGNETINVTVSINNTSSTRCDTILFVETTNYNSCTYHIRQYNEEQTLEGTFVTSVTYNNPNGANQTTTDRNNPIVLEVPYYKTGPYNFDVTIHNYSRYTGWAPYANSNSGWVQNCMDDEVVNRGAENVNETEGSFSFYVHKLNGNETTYGIDVQGNFSNDAGQKIVIHQAGSEEVSGFEYHDEGFYKANGSPKWIEDNEGNILNSFNGLIIFYAAVNCSDETWYPFSLNLITSDSWITVRKDSDHFKIFSLGAGYTEANETEFMEHRTINGEKPDWHGKTILYWISILVDENTTGSDRVGYVYFPGMNFKITQYAT